MRTKTGPGADTFEINQRVVINANIGCGQCDSCSAGRDNLCQDWHLLGETIHGTFGEFVVVPARNLLALPDEIDFDWDTDTSDQISQENGRPF